MQAPTLVMLRDIAGFEPRLGQSLAASPPVAELRMVAGDAMVLYVEDSHEIADPRRIQADGQGG